MKSQKQILIAFLLNAGFAVFEFFGGLFTGSTAIFSDALHDMGDALHIGLSYFLERKSNRPPDRTHTYGYRRYAALGALITDTVLIFGSLLAVYRGIRRILEPAELNSGGMLLLALIGFSVNLLAVFFTKGGGSLNRRAVNLHMLEDVLGWAVVLVGSVVIRLTGLDILDPILSIAVALFILIHAGESMKEILDLFLEKVPHDIDLHELEQALLQTDGVKEVRQLQLRGLDGEQSLATLHAVTDTEDAAAVKERIRTLLQEQNITCTAIEIDTMMGSKRR